METIFALASARGKAGIAVVRISGPDAVTVCQTLCAVPARQGLRQLRTDGELLDEALVLRFQEGHSFTGEEVVELHLHGSAAVVDAVLAALSSSDARLADPGEFTRRALENDRLDLAQVEGLADLIEAETEAQRRQALALMQGKLSGKVETWRSQLIRAAALIEATIDFADEDVPVDVTPEVAELLSAVEADLEVESAGSFAAERIRDGFEVAIVGPPNIGKSTLLNALAGRDAAITSDIAGTTRDVIEVRMDLSGLPVTLLDTAGLREATDAVEAIGVGRARDRARNADLRVFLTEDGTTDPSVPVQLDDLVLRGKQDDGGGVSGRTGAGITAMVDHITTVLSKRVIGVQSAVRARHRLAIGQALGYIRAARGLLESHGDAEFVALELRNALSALDSLIGRIGVEDLLDEIFASFCLGK